MNWYDFGRNDVYIGCGGRFKRSHCETISRAEKDKVAEYFRDKLIKIYFEDGRSYDNSDDERAKDSFRRTSSYVYRTVDVGQDLYGLVWNNGEIIGVVFYVTNTRGDADANVFYFSGHPQTSMTLGYSASHSSSYTTVCGVELVKKGEDGAPEDAKQARFIQSKMYPEI